MNKSAIFSAFLSLIILMSLGLSSCTSAAPATTPTAVPSFALLSPTPSPTPIPSPTSTPQPSSTPIPPVDFPIAGTWTGNARNGTFDMQVVIHIKADCHLGDLCGTFDLQNIPCSGTFTLIGQEHGTYEFQAGNMLGTCGIGRDFLQLTSDGSLQYTSRGDYGETLGVLTQKSSPIPPAAVGRQLPVIYNDDGCPDGTTALLYLLAAPGISLKAVTISHGEAHPQVYIQHLGRLLDNFGISGIPLGAGQDAPLTGSNEFPEWLRQSASNFWGLPIPNPLKTYPVEEAPQLMVAVMNQATEPVTVFVSGPLTDLAMALRLDPNIRKNIKAVYIMGGAIYAPGNLSDLLPNPVNITAEWNIYGDPQAAQEVFASKLEIYLVPLDATNQVKITRADTSQWRAGGKIGNFAADVYDMLLSGSSNSDMAIWDVMTSEIMVTPDLCSFQALHLEVVTQAGNTSGQTILVPGIPPNIQVCLRPNAGLLKQTLLDIFSNSR